jgi:hypothetical protein
MTTSEANNIISIYYPDYLTIDELETKYTRTPEYKNLTKKCNDAKSKLTIWDKIINEITERLPKDFYVQDWTHLFRNEPSLRLRITYPTLETMPNRIRELMLNVSILINHFSIYLSEKDLNPIDKTYSLPIIGLKNYHDSKYLLIEPPNGSIEAQVKNQFLSMTTKNFIYDNQELDKTVYNAIETAISKYFPDYKIFESSFLLEPTDSFTNGNKLMGETTYFDCLFSDHIF